MNYITSKEICQQLKITRRTLQLWKDQGRLEYIKLTDRKYLYDIDSILKTNEIDTRINVIYSRVSNTKQQADLKSQSELLVKYMVSSGIRPDLVLEEIASGMNENRTELNKLIQLVIEKKVKSVYISYKDRLTRFGFDYFRLLFSKFGTTIKVVNSSKEEDFQHELTEDLISIIHHFSMKMYSNRRRELKKAIKSLQEI